MKPRIRFNPGTGFICFGERCTGYGKSPAEAFADWKQEKRFHERSAIACVLKRFQLAC